MWEFARSFWVDERPASAIDRGDGVQAVGGDPV
jgi:hypothetical protein